MTGVGDEFVIAFHGFNQDKYSFSSLYAGIVGKQVIAVDLPYHGQTGVDSEIVSPLEMIAFIELLMETYQFSSFHLLGYSIGGKVAIKVYELMTERVSSLILLASDGMITDRYYHFAVDHFLGEKIFRWVMMRPHLLTYMVNMASRYKFFSQKKSKFILANVHDEIMIQRVRIGWPGLKRFTVNRQKIVDTIRHLQTPIMIAVGKYDQVIPPRNASYWHQHIPHLSYHELAIGHSFFTPNATMILLPIINDFYATVK